MTGYVSFRRSEATEKSMVSEVDFSHTFEMTGVSDVDFSAKASKWHGAVEMTWLKFLKIKKITGEFISTASYFALRNLVLIVVKLNLPEYLRYSVTNWILDYLVSCLSNLSMMSQSCLDLWLITDFEIEYMKSNLIV